MTDFERMEMAVRFAREDIGHMNISRVDTFVDRLLHHMLLIANNSDMVDSTMLEAYRSRQS